MSYVSVLDNILNSVDVTVGGGSASYLCSRVLEIGRILEGKSNSNAASDLNIGVNLAKGGVDGCLQNVNANLPLIKTQEVLEKLKQNIEFLKSKEV